MVAFSPLAIFDVRLPSGDDANSSVLYLTVVVRDTADCVTEVNITSVTVTADSASIDALVSVFHTPNSSLTALPVMQLLSSGNQNIVGQLLTSLSQQLNELNIESLDTAVVSKDHPHPNASSFSHLSCRWCACLHSFCFCTRWAHICNSS
jgi:hypothetical protein